jgi:hypothetical protein
MAFTILGFGYCWHSFAVLLGLQPLIVGRPGAIQAIQQPPGLRPQSGIYSSRHRPSSCSDQIVAGERSQLGPFSRIEKSAWPISQRDSCGHARLHHDIDDAEEYLIRRMIGYGTCATSFRPACTRELFPFIMSRGATNLRDPTGRIRSRRWLLQRFKIYDELDGWVTVAMTLITFPIEM